MTEKELIAKIKELRQIKPRKDWVVLAKSQIFGKEAAGFSWLSVIGEMKAGLGFLINHRYAFASSVSLIVLVGLFGFSLSALPGDTLYSIKRATERGQAVFVSEKELPKHNLEIVNKRLDDLARVVRTNSNRNLEPAINEFKASVSEAARSLAQKSTTEISAQAIILEVKKLEEKTQEAKSLGVEIGETEEFNDALSQLVSREIEYLESRSLTDEQKVVLEEVKKDFELGNYTQALERILMLNSQ